MVDAVSRPFGIGGALLGVVVGVGVLLGLVLQGRVGRCSDVDRLVAESATDFEAIRGERIDPSAGEWSTTYVIGDASTCSIVVDPERARYACTWEYPLTTGEGRAGYDAEVERVRACLGGVSEREDASVNHPDFWASTHFVVPDGEVIVSLKNKSALGVALVTVGADAPLGR